MVKLNGESQKGDIHQLLAHFKDYAISHRYLTQVDNLLMNAIREPAGFAHVLVYGPSGVGKSTMIRQIAKRLNGNCSILSQEFDPNPQWSSSVPLLLMETRPPDNGVFNRADY
jgi:Holliday junction resolvasome RuvABC ATP-dependent DNA helicase subunit